MGKSVAGARLVALAAVAVLLGAWHLTGLRSEPAPSLEAPALEAELIDVPSSAAVLPADAHPVPVLPGGVSRGAPVVPGASQAVGPAQAVDAGAWSVAARPADPGQQDGGYGQLLDTVFGPERFVPGVPDAGIPETASEAAERAADGAVALRRQAPSAGGPTPADAESGSADARRRPITEKASYEEYLALARQDAHGLEQRADAVIRGSSEDCQKVAMLRALYDTDPARSLDRFVQAISTLPDRSRPEAVSVPAFAVSYLGQRVADPAVKDLVERIAWNGYLNVSPELRRQAAESLTAKATLADLQRYAGYPAYQELVAAMAAESTVAR